MDAKEAKQTVTAGLQARKEARQANARAEKYQEDLQEVRDARFLDHLRHDVELRQLRAYYEALLTTRLRKQAAKAAAELQSVRQTYTVMCVLALLIGVALGTLLGVVA